MDIRDYIDQGDVWISRDGALKDIEDMGASWRRNAARWMIRHAGELWVAYREATLRYDVEQYVEDNYPLKQTTPELVATLAAISKPDEWVRGTELFRALTEGLRADAFADEADDDPPLRLVR